MQKIKNILTKTKNIILKIGAYLFVLALLFFVSYASVITISNEMEKEDSDEVAECNIQGIELHGYLTTYLPKSDYGEGNRLLYDETSSESIMASIERAESNDKIKGILLEVDSGGGSAVAGFEVSEALERSKKPSVAYIRKTGASGAYLAAIGTDHVFASQSSDIGSIGVTMSYLDNSKKNKKDGLTYNELSIGKFKDTGTSNKALSKEETDLLMRDVKIIYQNFIDRVTERRGLAIEDVKKIADGSTMLGQMALENKLIDQIGGFPEVEAYLAEKIGEEVEVCWN